MTAQEIESGKSFIETGKFPDPPPLSVVRSLGGISNKHDTSPSMVALCGGLWTHVRCGRGASDFFKYLAGPCSDIRTC